MRRHPRLVGFLWHWHRRLGLLAALLALLLATTGIALNHSSQLALDRKFVTAEWLYQIYSDSAGELPAYQAGEHWLIRGADGGLYLDDRKVADCHGELVGGVSLGGLVYAACAEELLLATTGGELVESISAATGLPAPLSGIGITDGGLVLQARDGWRLADLDRLEFHNPVPGGAIIQQLAPGTLPATLRSRLPLRDTWLSWERLLLDLHSGRLGGSAGVWLVDAAGVMFCLLGMSGVAMWWLHRRGGRRRPGVDRRQV